MKKILLTLIVLLSIHLLQAQGIEFFHGTLEEAKEIAKRENKLIFVDCYTTWCGPCKMLSKFVFTDPEMGEFYNENFINLKLDMEKEGSMFAIEYGISAYPTLVYIDHTGAVRKRLVGGRDVKTFLSEGKAVLLPDENLINKYKERFDGGERNIDFLKSYIRILSKAEKSLELPLVEYLYLINIDSQKISPQTDFIFEITNHVFSKGATILTQEKALYTKQFGEKKYDAKLMVIANFSAKDAAKNKDENAFKKSIDFLKNINSSEKNKLQLQLEMLWFESIQDWKNYINRANIYSINFILNDSNELQKIVQKIDRQNISKSILKQFEKTSVSINKKFKSFKFLYLHTNLLIKLEKGKEAAATIDGLNKICTEEEKPIVDGLRTRLAQMKMNNEKSTTKVH